jgi:glutamyl-tRNA synthetase
MAEQARMSSLPAWSAASFARMPLDGRYAPSPSGPLHLGNLRTALLAWLFARSRGARFLLRIEDLDPQRSREQWVTAQAGDLRALGIDWDGEPVRQSERTGLYEAALARLAAKGLLYECFCTRAEIREAASAPHGNAGGLYPGTCLSLTAAQRAERWDGGRLPAMRVRAGRARVRFADRVLGPSGGVVDDLVVRRNDGAFSYNLAVVVDDADQGVGEVVRGADLLDATPGQLWLAEQLAIEPPRSYAHVPLMLGEDGARLAKRHGAATMAERLSLGETPGQVRATLAASVGLADPGELLTPAELVSRFASSPWSQSG